MFARHIHILHLNEMTTRELIEEIVNNPNYRHWKPEQLYPVLLALLNNNGSYTAYTAIIPIVLETPDVTVLQNSLDGNIEWSYNDDGAFIATLMGGFKADKTFITATTVYDVINAEDSIPAPFITALTEDEFYIQLQFGDGPALYTGTINIEIRVYD
jgi:hypothetical protein